MTADNHVINGVVVATVHGEPDELGRVELSYDWMEGEHTSFRAPIATLMSGGGRGSWIMPEQGDEVLVAFDHGRFEHPFVVGSLWNGNARPPNEGIDRNVRRFQTVSGHQLDFDDRDGSAGITLRTAGGHTLQMADTAPGKIELKTAGGHQILLDDGSMTISLQSSGGVSIEIDSMGQVSIKAPLGVDVQTLKASFSGIVEAQMIKATLGVFQAVQSPAHTSGWGTTMP